MNYNFCIILHYYYNIMARVRVPKKYNIHIIIDSSRLQLKNGSP